MTAPVPMPSASDKLAFKLRSSAFRHGREQSWQDLDLLVTKAEKSGIGVLDVHELQRLPVLYRLAVSSLSVARAIALDRNLILYLENLSVRAFLIVYGPREGLLDGLKHFIRRDFPHSVRAALPHILLAFLAIALGTLAGYLLVTHDEAWFSTLVAGDLAGDRGASSSHDDLLNDEIFAPFPGFKRAFIIFANFLFRHNTWVGLLTFGLGIAAGVPTILLLLVQGVSFGAFLALHANRGLLLDFVGWVSMHGVTEFGAIILCGAGGLVIAEHILMPGRYARLENLALNGRTAAHLVVGSVAMFFIAGLIEGGLRQLIANTDARLMIGATTALLWFCYFRFCGRSAA